MTPEEIVNALQREDWPFMHESADLIKRQAKALEQAEKALSHAIENQEWSHEETTILGEALANIRALKGE